MMMMMLTINIRSTEEVIKSNDHHATRGDPQWWVILTGDNLPVPPPFLRMKVVKVQ